MKVLKRAVTIILILTAIFFVGLILLTLSTVSDALMGFDKLDWADNN